MPPLLSIIIPTYNHTHCLPSLLDSIAMQDFNDFEIILVDDCSDEPCDTLAEAWRNKGFDLRLFRNQTRQYTKDTRLNGVEQARGDYIAFFDADDMLYGKAALGYHVAMLRESGADMLHFQIAPINNNKINKDTFEWMKPFADSIKDGKVFEAYSKENFRARTVHGKIATRALWQRCLAPARASSVRRYREDMMLCSLLFFHAMSYKGSGRIGYSCFTIEDVAKKAFGRLHSSYAMLTELVPYIRQNGASKKAADAFEALLLQEVRSYTNLAVRLAVHNHPYIINDETMHEIEQHCSPEIFVKILLTGYPVQDMEDLGNSNRLLQNFLLHHFGKEQANTLLAQYCDSLNNGGQP